MVFERVFVSEIENKDAFTLVSQTESNIVIRGSFDFKLIGQKMKISVYDFTSNELIDEITVTLRR